MDLIWIEFRSSDRETADLIADLVEKLPGQEPEGSSLVLPPRDELQAADPLVINLAIGFMGGLASGAGKRLGESAITWVITRVRARLSENKVTIAEACGQKLTISPKMLLEQEEHFSKTVVQQVSKKLK